MELERWLDAFWESWQPNGNDEARAGRKAYGEIRDAILEYTHLLKNEED